MTAVCEIYGYRLEHFYQRSFKEGGVTFGQLLALYEHAQKREIERHKFQAIMHGAEPKESSMVSSERKDSRPFMFGDPDDYKNMPSEEQKDLTEKMLSAHKLWAKKPFHPSGKVKFTDG